MVINETDAGDPATDTDPFQRNQYKLFGSEPSLSDKPLRGFTTADLGSVLREVINEGPRQTWADLR